MNSWRLADVLYALRVAVRKETKDLMWNVQHMSYCLVFQDRLERLGEAAPNSGGGQRTGGAY